jgi:AcrR family transcriptional regulator
MARPIHADAAATRRRILEQALALFAARGADGVSIRAIGAAAGVSLAMVHHYFGSKDELYAACIDSMYEKLIAMRPRLLAALAEGGPPAARVDAIVRAAFRFARAHRTEMRLLMRQVTAAGELDADRRERGQVPFLDEASGAIAPLLGRDAAAVRLALQSAAFLVARYAISADRELELFTGRRGPESVAAVEDHLVTAITALFS